MQEPTESQKIWLAFFGLVFTAIAAIAALLSAPKITHEAEGPLQANAILIEAYHHPSTTGIKYGTRFEFNGKMKFGPHVGVIAEKNLATFSWIGFEEKFFISNREICQKLVPFPKGTLVSITYQKKMEVRTKGNVSSRKYVGLEVLDVTPLN